MAFKIGDLFVKLGLKKDEFDKGLTDAKQQTSSFASAIGKIGGAIAGAFAVGQLVQFGKEVFNIATQAQGVQTAFIKIGTSGDLDNLRSSVKGTVSDLELMKRAVMASNFGIPVQELGRLFEFAAKRAQDTGQSIDYLVDSIVTGIGRKSPLILDNLGISAVQLKQKLGDVGMETASVADITRAVGQIAEDSLNKTGRLADNLGTKVQTLSASWENFKLTLSDIFSNNGFLQKMLDGATSMLQTWSNKNATIFQKFMATFAPNEAIRELYKAQIDANKIIKEAIDKGNELPEVNVFGKKATAHKSAVEQLNDLKKINDELEAQRILRQEFKGEKMQPITPLYQGVGDLMLPQKSADTTGIFGNLDSHYKYNQEKFNKFTKEFNEDVVVSVQELNDAISNGMADVATTFAEGLGAIFSGDFNVGEFGQSILQSIGKFMVSMGQMLIAYGMAMDAFKKAFTNPWAAIGAGIALVAIGSAITNSAKNTKISSGTSAASGYYPSGSSSAVAAISGNVVFELEGTKLKGVLNNTDRKNSISK